MVMCGVSVRENAVRLGSSAFELFYFDVENVVYHVLCEIVHYNMYASVVTYTIFLSEGRKINFRVLCRGREI